MTSQGTGSTTGEPDLPDAIAVTGLACRFPGAPDAETFWANLAAGRESITFRTSEELAALGVTAERRADPRFVPAGGVLQDIDAFDAEYFGITPRDAALMDPQHRLFLECVVTALEDAGQPIREVAGGIGVYASAGFNSYLTHHLLPHAAELADRADVQWLTAGDKDYLATQTSYRLGLTGPSLSVQTACSSALVAVHLASEALLSGECDAAVAGAVSAGIAQGQGYLHTEGGILSPDGHCRPFDADAGGTVFGSGVGVLVLKRLADAVADGDTVRAVLLGSAVNNDGDRKVGFTAPGLEGQVRVIRAAQSVAGIGPEDIAGLEAHGTGTALGDRIELAALDRVFADAPGPRRILGAVKSNVGHLDTCAGMAGLIKTILSLQHRTLLPTAHFRTPSSGLDESRFRVLTAAEPWNGEDGSRTAGVSSFGIGGTNTHVVVQDAPPAVRRGPGTGTADGWQLLPVSARTPGALDTLAARLESALAQPSAPALVDVAHTLQTGRTAHPWRRAVLLRPDDAPHLAAPGAAQVLAGDGLGGVAFLYPGQGAGSAGTAARLHAAEPVFGAALDTCLEVLRPWTGAPLRELLLDPGHADLFDRTEVAQPALFAVEYALTQWWAALGIRPVALAGHSVGELTAACAAGVFTLEDAARLVALRGELMSRMPTGAMLAVPLPEAALRDLLDSSYGDNATAGDTRPEVAAVNATDRCVATGEPAAVERLRALLGDRGVVARPLSVRHAFHSRYAEGLLEEFAALVSATPAQAPRIPIVSTVTGRPLTPEEATSPAYWARQLREPVRFADALCALPQTAALVEAGPGNALSGFARRTLGTDRLVLPAFGSRDTAEDMPPASLTALARLWERGTDIDWSALGERTGRRRVPLPSYPFARTRHWFEPTAVPTASAATTAVPDRPEDWLHVQAWSPTAPPGHALRTGPVTVLLLADEAGLADELAARLTREGARVHQVRPAPHGLAGGLAVEADGHRLDPGHPDAFRTLADELESRAAVPDAIVSCWALDAPAVDEAAPDAVASAAVRAVTVPAALAHALGERFADRPLRLLLVSDAALPAGGPRPRTPHAAAALGPARVLPLELPGSAVRVLDLDCGAHAHCRWARDADAVMTELAALIHGVGAADPVVAVRGRARLVPEPARPALGDDSASPAEPPAGTWLITGGLGGIGTAVASRLADRADRRLVLITRGPVPEGPTWHSIRPAGEAPAAITPDFADTLTALSANGSAVCLVQCDVTDERSLTEALGRIRDRYGPIAGIVHAAGLPGGGVLTLRRPEDIARTLAPKVLGTLLLHRLTEQDQPVLALCSSVLAATGAAGAADYTAANAFLDSFAHTTDTAVSIGWDRWSQTGMAVRSDSVHFADGQGEHLDHPLFDGRRHTADGWAEFRLRRGPHTEWLSGEHRVAGTPVLPGTALLDLAVAAHRLTAPPDGRTGAYAPVELDAVFTSPVRLPETAPPVVVVRLRPHREGGHDWEVRTAETGRPHGQGRVRPYDGPAPRAIDVRAPRTGTDPGAQPRDRGSGGLLTTGPRWRCVTQTYRDAGHVLLELRLPESHREDITAHPLHPALLDAATGAVADSTGRHLPVAYRKLILHQDLGADGYARVVPVSGDPRSGGTLVVDVMLTDPEGRPVVTVEGFVLRPTAEATGRSTPGGTPEEETAQGGHEDTREGITTRDGLRALDLILANPHLPHVLVSTRAQAVHAGSGSGSGTATGTVREPAQDTRPDDLVGRIARIWARMLGLPRVGPDDNLLELGADSLAVVQIAAEMRSVGFPASPGDLFAHPTAAALADRFGAEGPGGTHGEAVPDPASPTEPSAATSAVTGAEPPAAARDPFQDADLSDEDLTQVLNLFRSGQDKQ